MAISLRVLIFLLDSINNGEKSVEENYNDAASCAFCLDPLEDEIEINLTMMPECSHIFHKSWFKENVKHNAKNGFVRWPLCRTKYSVVLL